MDAAGGDPSDSGDIGSLGHADGLTEDEEESPLSPSTVPSFARDTGSQDRSHGAFAFPATGGWGHDP